MCLEVTSYYDPNTGRFINADGYIITGQGLLSSNMFAYCANNPTNVVDYSGEGWSFLWFGSNKEDSPDNTSHYTPAPQNQGPNPKSITAAAKYNENTVNVYESGKGSPQKNKVNVEMKPKAITKSGKSDPNIVIQDSYKIINRYEREAVLNVIINSPLYDSNLYTHEKGSYMTEWWFHNVGYYATEFIPKFAEGFGSVDLNVEQTIFAWDWNW